MFFSSSSIKSHPYSIFIDKCRFLIQSFDETYLQHVGKEIFVVNSWLRRKIALRSLLCCILVCCILILLSSLFIYLFIYLFLIFIIIISISRLMADTWEGRRRKIALRSLLCCISYGRYLGYKTCKNYRKSFLDNLKASA